MTDHDKLTLLRMSLDDTIEGLNPEYLLRWLDGIPADYMFWDIEDLVVALLGFVDFGCEYNGDDDWQEIWEYLEFEMDPMIEVVDGMVEVLELTNCSTLRFELPEWIVNLESLMGFLRESYGRRPLYAAELKDYLITLWFPLFC